MDDPLAYIRNTYGVPAHQGGRIRFISTNTVVRYGTITGGTHHLQVEWEDDGTEAPLHPTWHVWYLDEHGAVIWPVST